METFRFTIPASVEIVPCQAWVDFYDHHESKDLQLTIQYQDDPLKIFALEWIIEQRRLGKMPEPVFPQLSQGQFEQWVMSLPIKNHVRP